MSNYHYPEPNAAMVAAIQQQTQSAAAENPLRDGAAGAAQADLYEQRPSRAEHLAKVNAAVAPREGTP